MIQNKIFEVNEHGKDFIVGDIHGCLDQLNAQLAKVKFDKSKDRLFSVGDLIDRGPDSAAILELIETKWFHPVRGNHEDFMVDALCEQSPRFPIQLWYQNGGSWLERENLELMKWVASQIESKVPLTITVKTKYGNIGISHAQPPCRDWKLCEDHALDDHQIQTALWARTLIESGEDDWNCDNIDITIHGHTPVQSIKMIGNALFIDTGSFMKEFGHHEYPGVLIIRIDTLLNV